MKQKSIKLNFVMNSFLSISNFIFPIITFPYISRILTPVGTGKVSTATSVIAYFNIFAQLGIPTYGVRACAQVRDNREELTRTAHELLMINLIMSAFMYLLLIPAILFVPVLRDEKPLYVITSSTILLTSIGMEWLYKALEQYTYITVRSVIFKMIAMVFMFLLIHKQSDYVIYGAIAIFASSASNILNFINVRKIIDLKPVGGYHMSRHLKCVGIFLAMSCATTVYTNLDTVMLRIMTGDEEVGTAKALNFVTVLAGGATVYFILMAKAGVLLISGEAYSGSVLPMQLIMPTVFLIGISNILGIQMLVPMGKEKTVLWAEIGGAVIDLVINTLLIPKMRSAGASVGTLVAELFVTAFLFIYLREDLKGVIRKIGFFKIALSIVLATAATIGANLLTDRFLINVLLAGSRHLNFLTKTVEGRSFVELAVSFIVFCLFYLGMLILLRESLTIELIEEFKLKLRRKKS